MCMLPKCLQWSLSSCAIHFSSVRGISSFSDGFITCLWKGISMRLSDVLSIHLLVCLRCFCKDLQYSLKNQYIYNTLQMRHKTSLEAISIPSIIIHRILQKYHHVHMKRTSSLMQTTMRLFNAYFFTIFFKISCMSFFSIRLFTIDFQLISLDFAKDFAIFTT